jgi:3-oxoadipate enol-lactonase
MWGDKMASRLRLESTTYARRFVRAHEANAARPDLSNKLSEIRKPTLIVVGERDTVTPPEISEVMLREISDSRMVVLPECDHGCHEDRPDSFNSTVRDFLDRIEAGQFP